ncbi:hypothetical protein J6590_070408 [Homalodisca vitripennis]|nr:hypothetical protein J6590_070408 [Homalodisca vitripennis]
MSGNLRTEDRLSSAVKADANRENAVMADNNSPVQIRRSGVGVSQIKPLQAAGRTAADPSRLAITSR